MWYSEMVSQTYGEANRSFCKPITFLLLRQPMVISISNDYKSYPVQPPHPDSATTNSTT